ncbi:hypothetical protein [Chryseobacterium limigenitum]|uniref:Regulatory protein, luxR family n=1 Tax=Chryseobacterium limigenitum TaxID=1612149 RepID=A0A1K2ITM7_9FLAO|nr:hypothetical protein [Chryseobacterium limigenitum]SFZ95793.1 hypothetical protein SAMN05216324_112115 [Chryseobacterium limigenitum]
MRNIFIIFLLFYNLFIAQTRKEIDENLEVTRGLINSGKRKESVKLLDDIIQASIKIDYPKGVFHGYYRKSYCFYFEGDFYSSIKFAQLALQQDLSQIDYNHQVIAFQLLGQNFARLEMNDDAIKQYKKMAQLAEIIADKKTAIYQKNIAYNDMASILWKNKNNIDSSYYYFFKIYKDLSNMQYRDDNMMILLSKATTAMAILQSVQGRKDSSAYYLKKASTFIPKNVEKTTENSVAYQHLPYIYFTYNQLLKAKVANDLLLKEVTNEQNLEQIKAGYDVKSKITGKLKDTVQAFKDLTIYNKIRDSIDQIDQKNIKKSYLNIIGEKEDNIEGKTKKLKFLTVLIILFVLFSTSGLVYLRKYIKRKNIEKRNILQEKEELESKVNDSFEELVLLAKENSPIFLVRFQEIYPEFCQEIIKINPNIQNSELIFCAYLYLNFSTKDIARYTFVTPTSVQMRKYRLRKKINIPPDVDIYIWMKNLQ